MGGFIVSVAASLVAVPLSVYYSGLISDFNTLKTDYFNEIQAVGHPFITNVLQLPNYWHERSIGR